MVVLTPWVSRRGFLTLGAAAVALLRLPPNHRPLARLVGRLLVLISRLGALCGIGQASIDLIAGAGALDKAQRALAANHLRDAIPGARQLFYGFGPSLSTYAVIALLVLAAALAPRRIPWWSPALALVAAQLPALTLDLIPVAALGIAVASWPAYRALRPGKRAGARRADFR
jgi:hypothetical protein